MRALTVVRRRALLIGLCVVAATSATVGYLLLQEKEYTADASLLFRKADFSQELFGSDTGENSDPVREAATNRELVALEAVAGRTAAALPNGDFTREEIDDKTDVSADGESELVTIEATENDPQVAAAIANTFARQFIEIRIGADKAKLDGAKKLAEAELRRLTPAEIAGPRGEALSRAVERLGVLASLQTGDAEIVQPATVPKDPSWPRPLRDGILGALIGLLIGVVIAFVLEAVRRRLHEPEELRERFGLPVLGTVPQSKALVESNAGGTVRPLPFAETEAFRMLRASLRYFNVDRDLEVVLVASHDAGVGKSTVAWNLARAGAMGSRTIVLETDLRNPSLTRQHGLRHRAGLTEVLTRQSQLDDAIQSVALDSEDPPGNGGSGRRLDVIAAGGIPPNPGELIESQAMAEVLAELRGRYDFIVVDTAPMGVVSDAFPLLRLTDGVIVAVRMGQSTTEGVDDLVNQQLRRLDAPLLGMVANGVRPKHRGKYGYGYYGPPPGETPVPGHGGGETPGANGSRESAPEPERSAS